ncbi:putative serine/threonine-protein kinase isoform X2 [Glycine soja]|uniref:putative serine/threonine-protein kinase isoform X2 n=1 Tax=Glycine max TaxID=3847 RepID=UPI0003DECF83|nr:putative serine/threonine-protein kinase isoform X2 [Glycine max]XP_028217193.1 putative serine/threonine-protein kinase isoform X2 [Glycine soja]|eukprot:XP_006604573.1 putative serine/threonine-protein kinase isoform X2 [Glycine max]
MCQRLSLAQLKSQPRCSFSQFLLIIAISKTFTNRTPKSNILRIFTLLSSHEESFFFLHLFLSIDQRTNQARIMDCICNYPTEEPDEDNNDGNFRLFTYRELNSATRGFHPSEKIGEGGFGTVYKLRDGTLVAVKVLSIELDSLRGEREFVAELNTLTNIKHHNLVNLRGCCVEGAHRYIVYDYMENNSLRYTFLGSEQKRMEFSWETRRDVSIGVARGLAFLHEEHQPHIVHRDIKSSNVLLDPNFTPKVSDFGLAKLLRDEKSHVTTHVAGTLGYLAPDYASSGHLTRKSDVYSFGVLLLEIVSGQRVVDAYQNGERFIVEKAWAAYEANDLLRMVDPVLNNNYPAEEVKRFLMVGLRCVQEMARLRPRMSEVLDMLTNNVDMGEFSVSKPGLVTDLRSARIRSQMNPSEESSVTAATFADSSGWSTANLAR